MVAVQTPDAVFVGICSRIVFKPLCLCRAPAETNGFDVSNNLVEYWALDGANEVQ